MATNNIYLQQILMAKTHILASFKHAHELLNVREANLLKELEAAQDKYEKEAIRNQQELRNLEVSKRALKGDLLDNRTRGKTLAAINDKMQQIRTLSSGTQIIRFQWNNDIEKYLLKVGQIITSSQELNIENLNLEDFEGFFDEEIVPNDTKFNANTPRGRRGNPNYRRGTRQRGRNRNNVVDENKDHGGQYSGFRSDIHNQREHDNWSDDEDLNINPHFVQGGGFNTRYHGRYFRKKRG